MLKPQQTPMAKLSTWPETANPYFYSPRNPLNVLFARPYFITPPPPSPSCHKWYPSLSYIINANLPQIIIKIAWPYLKTLDIIDILISCVLRSRIYDMDIKILKNFKLAQKNLISAVTSNIEIDLILTIFAFLSKRIE